MVEPLECYYKEEKHIIPTWEIKRWVNGMGSLRDRALVSFAYITGARVGEICRVKRGDIEIDHDEGFMYIRLLTLKRRNHFVRTQPHLLAWDKGLKEAFMNYLVVHTKKDAYLFPSERMCQYIIKRITGHGCHCFRHTRNDFLSNNGFDAYDLKEWNGWASIITGENYVGSRMARIKRLMREGVFRNDS